MKINGAESPQHQDLHRWGVEDLTAAIRRGTLTARQAVEASLARISALDAYLHAFCAVDTDGALESADRIDHRLAAGHPVGPLAGVPVGIKDLISVKGMVTTFGSPLYAGRVSEEDDIAVERLKGAGAIVVGKTNTSEFGYGAVGYNSLFAATLNPWNPKLGPGGSSAGSAVAVATGMVPLALGSDGGGSIRVPAALCGVFGLKPSWGRVPVYPGCRDERLPGASGWESLEHIGPLVRSARDAAIAMSVLAGPAPQDRHSLPREISSWDIKPFDRDRRCRIAFSAGMGFAPVDPEVLAIANSAVSGLKTAIDAIIEHAEPSIVDPQQYFEAIVALETDRVGLRRMAAERRIEFGPSLSAVLSRTWTAGQFTDALFARKSLTNAMWRFMQSFDFLLTPTTAVAAWSAEADSPPSIAGETLGASGCAPLAAIANLTGLPAASVPVGLTSDGRPVGLQVTGSHHDDVGVLSLCATIERLQKSCYWSEESLCRDSH